MPCYASAVDNGPPFFIVKSWRKSLHFMRTKQAFVNSSDTHGAAPNALLLVSLRMAENVFVMTATNRLMSQKFNTMMHTMKKKHEIKNSESIMSYIKGDH
jgi:hypothetical protein